MKKFHYHINIFYSRDDNGFVADVPDLEHCSAFGETPKEALNELEVAMDAWFDSAKKKGKNIPKPMYRPAIYQAQS